MGLHFVGLTDLIATEPALCDAVSTEEEAVQKIQQTDYDLIFVTLQWSVECSVQKIRAIRSQYACPFDPPLIALTKKVELAVRTACLKEGGSSCACRAIE